LQVAQPLRWSPALFGFPPGLPHWRGLRYRLSRPFWVRAALLEVGLLPLQKRQRLIPIAERRNVVLDDEVADDLLERKPAGG
jgi:hypothetical protein